MTFHHATTKDHVGKQPAMKQVTKLKPVSCRFTKLR